MTDDTSQPPAPQPGWVATVQVEMTEHLFGAWPRICFPGGHFVDLPRDVVDALDWSPPPPPPWEPEIGKEAWWVGSGPVNIHGIKGEWVWVEDDNKTFQTAHLCDLSPPKGGAA